MPFKPGLLAPVILIGSHRSGTSAVARALRDLGLFTGNPERCDHHGEAYFFIHLHDRFMERCTACWYEPEAFSSHVRTPGGLRECRDYLGYHTNGRFGVGPLHGQALARRFGEDRWRELLYGGLKWGWKDPRTTLFIEPWLRVFPRAKVLHLVRHPLDAALSLQQRELRWAAEGHPLATGVLHDLDTAFALVNHYVEAAMRVRDYGRYREVRFEDVQNAPQAALKSLAEFCGLNPPAATLAEVAATIQPEKRGRWLELAPERAAELMAAYRYGEHFGYEATPAAVSR